MDELQDWIKKTNPVITRIQPAPGTDDHNYGQLVKLLREKNYVGPPMSPRQVVLLPFWIVCRCRVGDRRPWPVDDEPSHRAVAGFPARCSISDHWDA